MEAAQTEKQTKAFRIASPVVLGLAIMTLLLPAYALIYIVPVFGGCSRVLKWRFRH